MGSDKKVNARTKISTPFIDSPFLRFISIKVAGNNRRKCKLLELAISSKLIIGKKIRLRQLNSRNRGLETRLERFLHVIAQNEAINIQTKMKFTSGRIVTGKNVISRPIILETRIK